MSAIEIEHGVPIPRDRSVPDSQAGQIRAALSQMKAGDSFMAMFADDRYYRAAHDLGIRITIRKQDKGGWRVWRTK